MPIEIPDNTIHRLCVRCGKWYWPDEGRDYILPRTRPLPLAAGRALAGIEEPIRFLCRYCDRKRRNLRLWVFGGLVVLVVIAIVLRWMMGP